MAKKPTTIRNLHLILGDQLDHRSPILDGFDDEKDALWMAEAAEETTHVWCHKLRIAFFFSAMRHHRDWLEEEGHTVLYTEMPPRPAQDRGQSLPEILSHDIEKHRPEKLVLVLPGDHRVHQGLEETAKKHQLPLEVRADTHFYETPEDFQKWAEGRKTLVLETYYRHLRKKHQLLLEPDGKPAGGEWNFDKENRETFGKDGPPETPQPPRAIAPDQVTQDVIRLVEKRFPDHPGSLEHFDLPTTRQDALAWLDGFIEERLPRFGTHQDALWTGEHFLYHSRLSALLNTKLLSPREAVDKAIAAYEKGRAPINSVEGFVRQVLGWREFVRGVYWAQMPGYLDLNHLDANHDLPKFFWDGQTDMACLRDAMQNVLQHGYAHHIQRLMVLGLYAQIYGASPRQFHDWHMAMYLDAIDWASAPNTIGMSQYADGGIVGTKPYCASGNYIHRMSNHCASCPYHPKKATGDDACPFTTLYWDFLDRNYPKLKDNRRMLFQVKNYEKKKPEELDAIRAQAKSLRGKS